MVARVTRVVLWAEWFACMGQLMLVREGEVRFVFVTRLGYGVGFEETLKMANDPNVLARQRRRMVTSSWESAWFDWHLARLQAAAREAAEVERCRWKLECI